MQGSRRHVQLQTADQRAAVLSSSYARRGGLGSQSPVGVNLGCLTQVAVDPTQHWSLPCVEADGMPSD